MGICLRTRDGAYVMLKSTKLEEMTDSQREFVKDLVKQDEEFHKVQSQKDPNTKKPKAPLTDMKQPTIS